MWGQARFFDVEERLKELSAKGDELERLNGAADFELFRGDLERAAPRSDHAKGGRPAFNHMLICDRLNTSIPNPAPMSAMEATVTPLLPGSR
jgi:hypothetical protein